MKLTSSPAGAAGVAAGDRAPLGQQIIRVGSDRYIGTVLKKGPPGGGCR